MPITSITTAVNEQIPEGEHCTGCGLLELNSVPECSLLEEELLLRYGNGGYKILKNEDCPSNMEMCNEEDA